MSLAEKERILFHNTAELPLTGYLKFRVSTNNSRNQIEFIKKVISCIAAYNEENWPEDQVWDLELPAEFLIKIKKTTNSDIEKNPKLWDYGSWLDAMKYRGWEWYSSGIDDLGFIIILEPYNFPFSVDPLEYLIIESGVQLKNIHYEDHSTS